MPVFVLYHLILTKIFLSNVLVLKMDPVDLSYNYNAMSVLTTFSLLNSINLPVHFQCITHTLVKILENSFGRDKERQKETFEL